MNIILFSSLCLLSIAQARKFFNYPYSTNPIKPFRFYQESGSSIDPGPQLRGRSLSARVLDYRQIPSSRRREYSDRYSAYPPRFAQPSRKRFNPFGSRPYANAPLSYRRPEILYRQASPRTPGFREPPQFVNDFSPQYGNDYDRQEFATSLLGRRGIPTENIPMIIAAPKPKYQLTREYRTRPTGLSPRRGLRRPRPYKSARFLTMDYKSPKDEQEEIVTFRPAFKPKKLPREEPPTERKDLSYDIERNIKGRLLRAKSSSVPRYRGEASIPRRSSVVPTQRRPPQRRPLRRVVKAGHQSSEIPNYKKGLGELEDITGQLKKLQKTKNSDTNWQKSYGYEDRAYGSTEGDIGGSMNRAYGFAKKGYGFENRPKEPVEVEIDISPVARSPPNEEHRLTRRYNPTRVRPRKSPNEKQDSRELIARIRESVRDDLHGRAMIPDSSARREESRPTTRDRSEDKKFPYEATRFPSLEKTYGYDDKGFGFTNSENRNEKQGFGFTRQSYGVDNKDEPVREPKRSRYFDRRRNFIDGRHNQGIRKTYQRRAGPGKRRRDG